MAIGDIPELEIAWLAGLLEGEGCFSNRSLRYCSLSIQLIMTDADVVVRAAKAMGAYKVVKVKENPNRAGSKQLYRAVVYGDSAIQVMERILPYMGERRSKKIIGLLNLRMSASKSPYPIRKSYSRGAEIVWSSMQ